MSVTTQKRQHLKSVNISFIPFSPLTFTSLNKEPNAAPRAPGCIVGICAFAISANKMNWQSSRILSLQNSVHLMAFHLMNSSFIYFYHQNKACALVASFHSAKSTELTNAHSAA